ncbi:hypothetical protein [Longimicrobium sp.]|jgi:hypothetical protein|uniref:hypothetical protein n=1 Tax=Longimicrobium sp. TaxID=2029185 RepID=UPI002EDA7E93
MKLVLFTACMLAAVPASAQSGVLRLSGTEGKVTAPVTVELVPLPDPGPGRRRVRIVGLPSVSAPSLTLDVSAENGIALASPVVWTGAATAGEEVALEVELVVNGPGEQRLVVAATVKHDNGFSQTGLHVFSLNPAANASFLKRLPAAPTDPGGRRILEVPAATP